MGDKVLILGDVIYIVDEEHHKAMAKIDQLSKSLDSCQETLNYLMDLPYPQFLECHCEIMTLKRTAYELGLSINETLDAIHEKYQL